jgi:hypothetical protein
MDSDDVREPVLEWWLYPGIWLLVSAGVLWCWWTSWQEGTPSDGIVGPRREPEFIFVATPDPIVMHWLPAVAGCGALIAGLISSLTGRGSLRYLGVRGNRVGDESRDARDRAACGPVNSAGSEYGSR